MALKLKHFLLKNDGKNLIYAVLAIVAVGIFIFHYLQISPKTYPLSLDPYYFAANAQYRLENGFFNSTIAYNALGGTFSYQPLLVWLIGGLSWLTSLPTLEITMWLGPVIALTIPFIAYRFFSKIFNSQAIALLSAAIFALNPYLLYRETLTLPEGVGYIFYIWFFTELVIFLKSEKKRRLTPLILMFALVGIYFLTHASVLYLAFVTLPFLFLISIKHKKYFLIWLALLILFLIVLQANSTNLVVLKTFLSQRFAITPLDGAEVSRHFGGLFWVGFSALVVSSLIWLEHIDRQKASLIIMLTLPFLLLYVFWQNQNNSFEPIWRDRFTPFLAFGFISCIGFVLDELLEKLTAKFKINNKLILGVVLVALAAYPFFITVPKWFWVYSDNEVQSINYLKNKAPQKSIVFAKPLFVRLIAGVGNLYTIQDYAGLNNTIYSGTAAMKGYARKNHYSSAFLFISNEKHDNEYFALFSDGKKRKVGYPKELLQKIAPKTYYGLPIVYQKDDVTIYKLY